MFSRKQEEDPNREKGERKIMTAPKSRGSKHGCDAPYCDTEDIYLMIKNLKTGAIRQYCRADLDHVELIINGTDAKNHWVPFYRKEDQAV